MPRLALYSSLKECRYLSSIFECLGMDTCGVQCIGRRLRQYVNFSFDAAISHIRKDKMKGIYYFTDKSKAPDVIVYYGHGE